MRRLPILTFITLLIWSCAKDTPIRNATAVLTSTSSSGTSGIVNFIEKNGKVTMNAEIYDIATGQHAIHIHENGVCNSEDGTAAGGHWNPTDQKHGKWGEGSFHLGDIGNFEADSTQYGVMTLTTDLWCVGCGDSKKDITQKSIIIHEGIDDCHSQPSGAAGKRVACGVILEIKEDKGERTE